MKSALLMLAALLLGGLPAHAYEVKSVYAKYQTNYSWSQAYQVRAQIYNGQELNEATGNHTLGDMTCLVIMR